MTKNSHCSNSAADSSLAHGSSVKVQLKQAWTVWIRRLFASLRVCFQWEMPFTPFNCYSFLLSLTSPLHNVLPLCAELDLLCVQTFSRPYRDLSSLCLYAHREIHFSSFITAQACITITCPFYTAEWNKWAFSSTINMWTHCWHMDKCD